MNILLIYQFLLRIVEKRFEIFLAFVIGEANNAAWRNLRKLKGIYEETIRKKIYIINFLLF